MELELTEEQELLRATAERFIEEACPLTMVRELVDSDTGLHPDYLARVADLGWFAMLVSPEMGGGSVSGEGLRDLVVIAEERGRRLQPGAFIPMNVIAEGLARTGSAQQQIETLPKIVSGESVATLPVANQPGSGGLTSSVEAVWEGDEVVLSGETGLVQDAHLAEWLLVTAADGAGLSQFLVPMTTGGVMVQERRAHDITQRFGTVRCHSVRIGDVHLVGTRGGAHQEIERQLRTALVLSVAETVGAMDALFETTRRYAVDRNAFGRPIGSFQAIKHQLADMSLSLEAAKAVSVMASRAVQDDRDNALEVARIAKAWVGDVGVDLAQGCFQVFGGIGYTWEHDLHLFLRRITMNNLLYGQPADHREEICKAHGI